MPQIRRLFQNNPLLTIIATNIRDGDALGLHPDEFVKAIAQEIRGSLAKRFPDGEATAKDYIVELETICLGELPERLGSKYLFQAQAAPLGDPPEWYTTVVTVEHWQRYVDDATLDHLSEQAGIPLPFSPMGGSSDAALLTILKQVPTGEFVPGPDFVLGYPLVWITPRPAFEKKLELSAHPADFARDHLGLVHRGSGQNLIAMHLPASAVKLVESARPIFADAGLHRRFLVSAAERPPPFNPAWGQTLDLKRFEVDRSLASGGAERVCARIRSKHLDGRAIPFRFLGRVRETRGVAAATDQDFADCKIACDAVGYAQVVRQL